MSNSDLKKPKSLYSYTIKNLVKINTVGKGISEQARIRKQDFALGISNYPPIPPQILSLWLFRLFCILYLPLRKGN